MNNVDVTSIPKSPIESPDLSQAIHTKEKDIALSSLATDKELSQLTASIDKTTHTFFSRQTKEQQETTNNQPVIHQYDNTNTKEILVYNFKGRTTPIIDIDRIKSQHTDKPVQIFFFRKEHSVNPNHTISPLTNHITHLSSSVHIESFEYKNIA